MDCYDNCVLYHLNCKVCGRTFWSHDGFETICDQCKEIRNPFGNYEITASKAFAKCVICGEYMEVEDSSCVWIKVCDECKKAIKWAKTQMPES